jgi:hypothetical protein
MTVKKDEDLYEMAIQYKKDEDFSGWYTDVCRMSAIPGSISPADHPLRS